MKIKRADIERILILCAAALVVVLALRSNDQTTSQVLVEQTAIPIEQTLAQEDTVATVVFYEDGDGYLVPVTRQVPKTDGIAKATLALMVKDADNDMQAARLGLRTVIPEGTTFDIDISEGRANVNVSKEALSCIDARQESLMVDAITNALTCFSTVDEVTLEFDGQKRSKLTYGTDVSGVFTGGNLNLESVETFSPDAELVQLYFPSQTGRLLVPVTRAVFSDADPTTAVLELAKGPQDDSGLERALPENCGVKSVTMKDGVVVNIEGDPDSAGHGKLRRRPAGGARHPVHLFAVSGREKGRGAGGGREDRSPARNRHHLHQRRGGSDRPVSRRGGAGLIAGLFPRAHV